jgi:selenocysteine lyase/cysteine desulfurase
VLIFNRRIYNNAVPDHPGGGTIIYSNPWKARRYVTDIELREDGGTPPVLQGIKAAMCIRLKEEMGVKNILHREEELLKIAFTRLSEMTNVTILQGNARKRLGAISFIVKDAHYNLIVRLLNDKFGIQTRGGCSCAGTYGHHLLNVDQAWSHKIWSAIHSGNMSSKPGWIRVSFHPTMTDLEVEFIMDAIESTASSFSEWMTDYYYDTSSNEYAIKEGTAKEQHYVENWLKFGYQVGTREVGQKFLNTFG